MTGPLDVDPMVVIRDRVAAHLTGVLVTGRRPADLVDRLPVVVLSRRGGVEAESHQDVLADRPLVVADCYALGEPDAYGLAQSVRRALRAAGARNPVTGPIPAPDDEESAGVVRINVSYEFLIR